MSNEKQEIKAYWTNQRELTLEELKELQRQYEASGNATDYSFMNRLFHGLDGIIRALEVQARK